YAAGSTCQYVQGTRPLPTGDVAPMWSQQRVGCPTATAIACDTAMPVKFPPKCSEQDLDPESVNGFEKALRHQKTCETTDPAVAPTQTVTTTWSHQDALTAEHVVRRDVLVTSCGTMEHPTGVAAPDMMGLSYAACIAAPKHGLTFQRTQTDLQ